MVRVSPQWRRRAVRGVLVFLALVTIGPVLLILPLNVVQPPTTAVMLARTVQRWRAGQEPAYPRRRVVGRDAIAPQLRRAVLAAEDDRGAAGITRYPTTLASALDALEADDVLLAALGEPLARSYIAVRRSEWESYSAAGDEFAFASHFFKY